MSTEVERDEEQQELSGEELGELLQIRRDKLSRLQSEGRDPFTVTKYDVTAYSQTVKDHFEAMENQTVSMAGRVMSMRDMGKASFCDLQDKEGRIQLYVKINEVGEEAYEQFKKLDIGDIIGIRGFVFRTRRGEISVHVQSFMLLSKSLRPLPEKFHGLTNVDMRYRQRYVDLIMNPRKPRDLHQAFPHHFLHPPLPG